MQFYRERTFEKVLSLYPLSKLFNIKAYKNKILKIYRKRSKTCILPIGAISIKTTLTKNQKNNMILANEKISYPGLIYNISNIWEEAQEYCRIIHYKKNQNFLFVSENSYDFCYVHTGSVKGLFIENEGNCRTNFIFQKGALINETSFLSKAYSDKILFSCTCPTTIYYFDSALINESFKANYPHLMENMFYSIAVKLLNIQTMTNAICTKSSLELFCWYLYSMGKHHNFAHEFVPLIGKSDIASLLGISNTALKRNINFLISEDIIQQFTKKLVIITDYNKLKNLAKK